MTAKSKPKKKTAKKAAPQPLDPSLPLKSAKQESFCQHYVNSSKTGKTDSNGKLVVVTVSATDAYMKSGYKASKASANTNAPRLLANARVKQRISYLQQELALKLAEEGVADKLECCGVLSTILRDDEVQPSSRIQSVKTLADISGWNKSDENAENSINVHKEFLDALLAEGGPIEHNPQNG